ncbi:unnamed protein product [Victoria cruziana]
MDNPYISRTGQHVTAPGGAISILEKSRFQGAPHDAKSCFRENGDQNSFREQNWTGKWCGRGNDLMPLLGQEELDIFDAMDELEATAFNQTGGK